MLGKECFREYENLTLLRDENNAWIFNHRRCYERRPAYDLGLLCMPYHMLTRVPAGGKWPSFIVLHVSPRRYSAWRAERQEWGQRGRQKTKGGTLASFSPRIIPFEVIHRERVRAHIAPTLCSQSLSCIIIGGGGSWFHISPVWY